jgi:ABC-type transport system involved in multi-copper enzyme maturation permease subunit
MFITLLVVTFIISVAVCSIVVLSFGKPISRILHRLIADDISQAWSKYLKFAIYVIGVSSGVRIWELEKYITPPHIKDSPIVELTRDRWVLEVYRTIIESLQGIAWSLLVFFVFALIAFVIVRAFELRKERTEAPSKV